MYPILNQKGNGDSKVDSPKRRRLKNLAGNLATAFLILGCVAIISPAFLQASPDGHRRNPKSALRLMATPLQVYVADFDERYPLADNWGVWPYLRNKPYAPGQNIAFMRRLSGKSVSSVPDPSRQAVFFETTSKKPYPATNFTEVWWSKERETYVMFADGKVRGFRYYYPEAPSEGSGVSPKVSR